MRPFQHAGGLMLLLLAAPALLLAQFDTDGAQVISYFPQLADGGGANQQWVTTLTFVNPHSSRQANGTVNLFGNDGKPLFLDFGTGPSLGSTLSFLRKGLRNT